MLGRMIGRVISGALWGAGASAVLSATRSEGHGLRPLAKTLMKGYVAAAERVGEAVAEARESLGDLYEEARTEREQAESEGARAGADAGRREPHTNGEPASVQ
jgi:hypothetical protein